MHSPVSLSSGSLGSNNFFTIGRKQIYLSLGGLGLFKLARPSYYKLLGVVKDDALDLGLPSTG